MPSLLPCGNEVSRGLGGRFLESSQARLCTSILDTVLISSFQITPLTLAGYPEGNKLNELGLSCFRCPQQSGGGRLCRRIGVPFMDIPTNKNMGSFGFLYTRGVLSLCLTYLPHNISTV